MLIKSILLLFKLGICELDWNDLRKYKNIIHFLVFEACHRSNESVEEISTTLEVFFPIKNLETVRNEAAHYRVAGDSQDNRLNHGAPQ